MKPQMNNVLYALILLIIVGCVYSNKQPHSAIDSYLGLIITNKNEIQAALNTIVVGKSTNCDVLRAIHRFPCEKWILSDNKYAYFYYNSETTVIENNRSVRTQKHSISKLLFVFKDDILISMRRDRDLKSNSAKYKYTDLVQKTEETVGDKGEDILAKIRPGMKKGTVFRIVGKPSNVYEIDDDEIWILGYERFNKLVDMRSYYTFNTRSYYITFHKNSIVAIGQASDYPSVYVGQEEMMCIK